MGEKKKVKAAASYDSLNSASLAPQPHHPSTIYNPNPFPFDPTEPDGVSRHNAFYSQHVRETRETETVDIEIEETKGFVSGKSRQSIDLDSIDGYRRDGDRDIEYDAARKANTIQKLGAGLKGALAKSGLTRNKDKEPEKPVDAVLQHQLQQQREQRRLQKQREQDNDRALRIARGRGKERQGGADSAHLYSDRIRDDDDTTSPRAGRYKQDPFPDRRSRPQSISPPPLPGQDRRGSATYWPEGYSNIRAEQTTPFIGYHPPPQPDTPRRYRPQNQQYQRPSRPLSLASATDYRELSRHADDFDRPRERDESNRRYREAVRSTPDGVRRPPGLNQVASADPTAKIPSEFGDDEESVTTNLESSRSMSNRLNRAREWVANNRMSSPAAPAPVMDREAVLASIPGAQSSRSSRRISVDGYGLVTPQRGAYLSGGRGYDSRERIAMTHQVDIQGVQRGYRNSMDDDSRYWRRQSEGYEHDQYRRSRETYEYSAQGGFQGYAPGGPDDVDQDGLESTIAPISALQSKKSLESSGILKKAEAAPEPSAEAQSDEEMDQLTLPKPPNKRRLILRLISLFSSLFVLIFLIAAAPVSKSSAPFSSSAGLAFHYVVAILSILVSIAFVFNYLSRRLRRKPKMKRYILLGLDIVMALMWFVDVFICISKYPCAVGGQNGWCDMYNTSIFLGMIALATFFAAVIWDICGTFVSSKLLGGRQWIKPPPPGFNSRGPVMQQGAGQGWGGGKMAGGVPGAWPGQMPGQIPGQMPGQMPGQGYPMKPKSGKAWW